MLTLIVALLVGIPSIAWAIVKYKAVLVIQQLTKQVLEKCPAAQRASVLEASAELASKLGAEYTTTKPISLIFGSHKLPQ